MTAVLHYSENCDCCIGSWGVCAGRGARSANHSVGQDVRRAATGATRPASLPSLMTLLHQFSPPTMAKQMAAGTSGLPFENNNHHHWP